MVQIGWTNQAVGDLKNIYEFIASDSSYYAKREISKIKLRVDQIKIFINIGRVVPEFKDQYIREVIEGNYRIVYKILTTSKVDILTIHHSSRNKLEINDEV